ncbi:MAG: hypothetical protein AAF609_24050, partial [Cyanobacteria bacterium P01_C01_bin.120]
ARALRTLAKYLPELWPEALEITRQISAESARALALRTLAKYLPPELWPEALEITRQISDESARASALSALAKYLPPELLPEAIDLVESFDDRYYAASAWSGLLPRLEELPIDAVGFTKVLATLGYRDRKDFLSDFPSLRNTLMRLGGDGVLKPCLQAMREVCTQWP